MSDDEEMAVEILSDVSKFRINGDYTDFTLRHVGGDFQVHKIIVCSQSKVFDAACKGGFEEAIKGIYTMDGLSYYELKKMVEFFYSGEYTPSMEPEDFKRAGTIFNYYTLHVKLYLLGDRFDCENLRAYALAQYKSYWGTFSEDDGCGYIFEHFRWLYGESETDSTFFRRFACSSWRKTFHHHLDEEEYNSRYNDLLRDLPEFAVDLLNGWEKVAALERKVEKDSSMSD